jgi:hypothetical protein
MVLIQMVLYAQRLFSIDLSLLVLALTVDNSQAIPSI